MAFGIGSVQFVRTLVDLVSMNFDRERNRTSPVINSNRRIMAKSQINFPLFFSYRGTMGTDLIRRIAKKF